MNKRNENEIFSELEKLCSSAGYIHVIAALHHKDNFIPLINGVLKTKDAQIRHQNEKVIRAEICLLIGLLIKSKIDFAIPSHSDLKTMIQKTLTLLEELHQSIFDPTIELVKKSISNPENLASPFSSGIALREPMIYGGDTAYNFQYTDFSLQRYQKDNEWFVTSLGFTIEDVFTIINILGELQEENIPKLIDSFKTIDISKYTFLPIYKFSVNELVKYSNLSEMKVRKIIEVFSIQDNNQNNEFKSISDFSMYLAKPIISVNSNEFILFDTYQLAESLYNSPFYWFLDDENYKDIAMKHRGEFTEDFCTSHLAKVFGKENVLQNIKIKNLKGDDLSEIDTLVLYADRAIIIQAKSKKLTQLSRKGIDKSIQSDFKKSIQDSYDQGFLCAQLIQDKENIHLYQNDQEIDYSSPLKEIYIFCIVSDNYPALNVQAREFLQFKTTSIILPPLVFDIFFLDVLIEFLNTPLYFISYINRRSLYIDQVLSVIELSVLSFHLQHNLWISDENDMLVIDDDFCLVIDTAMISRRREIPGDSTPDGILTRINNLSIGNLICQIENDENPACIDFGLFLLSLDESTIIKLNRQLKRELNKKVERKFSIFYEELSVGITIHLVSNYDKATIQSLDNVCNLRKYHFKASKWFGLIINYEEKMHLENGLTFDFPWMYDAFLESKQNELSNVKIQKLISFTSSNNKKNTKEKKKKKMAKESRKRNRKK